MSRSVRKCRSANCDARILWLNTAKNRPVPLDAEPAYAKGSPAPSSLAGLFFVEKDIARAAMGAEREIVDAGGKLTQALHLSHFVTCPDRDVFRRPKEKAAAK